MRVALLAVLGALVVAGTATAAPPNAADLEAEIVCPVCETTLDQSNAPIAQKMKTFIRVRIAAGDSESEIKDALVARVRLRRFSRSRREAGSACSPGCCRSRRSSVEPSSWGF